MVVYDAESLAVLLHKLFSSFFPQVLNDHVLTSVLICLHTLPSPMQAPLRARRYFSITNLMMALLPNPYGWPLHLPPANYEPPHIVS